MQVAIQQRACLGETSCGDAVVRVNQGDVTTLGVVDGLGHGAKAAEAAAFFCDYVRAHFEEDLEAIMQGAHRAMRGRRGVVATLLRVDRIRSRLHVVGLGNITLRAMSQAAIQPISFPGVVGARMRKIKQFNYPLSPGDTLVLFSDGISGSMDLGDYRGAMQDLDALAQRILREHGKEHDDATVLILRYDEA